MAVKTKVLTFTWENNGAFKVEQNIDGAGSVVIVKMEENGDIGDLFVHGITASLKEFCSKLIDGIEAEMKV